MSDLTRRRVVRSAATAAWAAPVIVAASAAPAYAGSGAPAVTTSLVSTSRPELDSPVVDAEMTFTNDGDANATALSVLIGINPTRGSFTANITQVATGWVADYQGYNSANQSFEWIFTRAAGLAAGEANASTLTFRFPAGMTGTSTGTIVVSAPVTTPPGDNQGSVGQYL